MITIEKKRSQCAIANGLEILGDRWTLLIIRDLMFTNRREFGHFLHSGEGISTNILAERLERLQLHNLIVKKPHPNHGKKFIYNLTDEGLKLAPTVLEFALWSSRSINKTFLPSAIINAIKYDRQNLMSQIENRIPLVEVKLNP